MHALVALLATTAAMSLQTRGSGARGGDSLARAVVSAAVLGAAPLAALKSAGERVVLLEAPLESDDSGQLLCDDGITADLQGTVGWVHVATEFRELVSARRAGATTVWLSDVAAASAGDIETQGYLATAIIDDFADAM